MERWRQSAVNGPPAMTNLNDALEDEYFESKASDAHDDAERIDYQGRLGSEFVFHWPAEETHLRLGIDHVCARILSSDAEWPTYLPQEIEGDHVDIRGYEDVAPERGVIYGKQKVHVYDDGLPKPVEMFADDSIAMSSVDDTDDRLLEQIKIANHLRENDRRVTGTLGDPREAGVGTVAYPFEFDGTDAALAFEFARPTSDEDAEAFEALVEECGGSPKFVPDSRFDVVPFQDTRRELARDDGFELWALVPEDDGDGDGIISRLRNLF